MNYRALLKSNFHYFSYFHKFLKYRIFITLGISIFVGVLDGVSLALFIPLLSLLTGNETTTGTLETDFISDFIINRLDFAPNLWNIFLLILFFFSLKGIAKFFESFMRVKYQQYFMKTLRLTTIDQLNDLDYKSFLKTDVGRIHNTLAGEIKRVNMGYVFYFRSLQYIVLVGVYLVFSFLSDWKFTLIVLSGGLIANLLFRFLFKRTKYFSKQVTEKSHQLQNFLIQKVHFFKYLKSTGTNFFYSRKLKGKILELEQINLKLGAVDALLAAIREPLSILVVFSAIFLNIYLFEVSLGAILLSLLLLYRAITYFMTLQEQWNVFLGVSGSLDNMKDFEDELAGGKEKSGSATFYGLDGNLELKNVSFYYDDQMILKGLNLKIKKNETIAIVGESGSGKTTLMNLLSGLLSPSSGDYLIDSRNINEFDLWSFRTKIGSVPQEAPVFNDSIYNNITFWANRDKRNLQKYRESIGQAVIGDFINTLPEKEETILGNNGINLSGGQRQRISIARELFKGAEVLFMDEATSSLDSETEALLQENLRNLKGKVTLIIIAHRLSTVKFADKIIVLDQGRIEGIGSYQDMFHQSDYFRRIVELQNL